MLPSAGTSSTALPKVIIVAEVKFAQYRAYEAQRVNANNAMMALLAGSHLASHTLKLTEGSDLLLPEIFPNVSHIGRFNLKTETATEILYAAEHHLSAMAGPVRARYS